MSNERFLVTGALGCIGAWVVRNLVQEGTPVVVYDLDTSMHRLKLIMSDDEIAHVQFIIGDITDLAALDSALQRNNITHIIHLAALQVPFCKANPSKGALVNVVGTVNVFEVARRMGLKRVVYASSVAVYGPDTDHPDQLLQHDAPFGPLTLYGVYKQANEGTARIYWADNGINSIGLRPYTIYGPGRDQGMTSGPTKAMLAAAAGKAYRIPFGGRGGYQLADDTAKVFIRASRSSFEGADVFNLKGSVVDMPEIVSAIEAAALEVRGQITFDPAPLVLPGGMDDGALVNALGPIHYTPLTEGVAATMAIFKQALAHGLISMD